MHVQSQVRRDIDAVSRVAAVPKILEVITRTTGLRFAAVARVTDQDWTACAVRDEIAFGLQPGGRLELGTTICNEIRQHRQPVVFGHASANLEFATHQTPRLYGLESYISVPIHRVSGEFFGTLCAIDPLPSRVESPEILQMMELFAELIGMQLESDERHALSQAALHTALDVAKLRERFINEVSDELKAPIQAMVMDAYTIKTTPGIDARTRAHVADMEANLWRMTALVGGLVDFAHDKLVTGGPLVRTPARLLAGELERVLSQVASAYPQRALATIVQVDADVDCDPARLGQLLVNLALNVFRHVAVDATVSIEVTTTASALLLALHAPGLTLSGGELDSVTGALSPRADAMPGARSWDFFIAGEIARAHDGRFTASAAPGGTRLSFAMPLRAMQDGTASVPATVVTTA